MNKKEREKPVDKAPQSPNAYLDLAYYLINGKKRDRYLSCVKWPKEVCLGTADNVSRDEHDSREMAESVCRRIEQEGLGGERKIFPIKTWVEPVEN